MGEITELLRQWREGDRTALERLMPLIYPRLRAIAGSLERMEGRVEALREMLLDLLATRFGALDDDLTHHALTARALEELGLLTAE